MQIEYVILDVVNKHRRKYMVENSSSQVNPIEYLWLGLYSFAGFSIELLLGIIIGLLNNVAISRSSNLLLVGFLWFGFATLLHQYSKRKFNFDVFQFNEQLTISRFLSIIVIVIIIIAINSLGFGGFKPFVEFNNGSQGDVLTYLSQVFYYLGESSLIVLTIAFGQQFFEKQFSLTINFPSGGIFLALTWGALHILLQGVNGGMYAMLFSVLSGMIYLLCKKDFKYSYLFVALAFIL